MPAIEAIGNDPQELRRSLRELVAASMLPAVWREYDAHQIAQSVTEVLIRMLGLEFALMSVRWRQRRAGMRGARQRPQRSRSHGGGSRRLGPVAGPVSSERCGHTRQSHGARRRPGGVRAGCCRRPRADRGRIRRARFPERDPAAAARGDRESGGDRDPPLAGGARAAAPERDPGGAGRDRDQGTHQGRGGVPPGAEDGGGRPAHRWDRPRLQQSAGGRARQPEAAAQAPAGRRPGRCA